MNYSVKIKTVDGETVLALPEHALTRLGASPGDTLALEETDKGLLLRNVDAGQMQLAEEIMLEDREALRALAK